MGHVDDVPMNATSRARLQTRLSRDEPLSASERQALKRIMDGVIETSPVAALGSKEAILLAQTQATKLLSAGRGNDLAVGERRFLNPTELLPGTLQDFYGSRRTRHAA